MCSEVVILYYSTDWKRFTKLFYNKKAVDTAFSLS